MSVLGEVRRLWEKFILTPSSTIVIPECSLCLYHVFIWFEWFRNHLIKEADFFSSTYKNAVVWETVKHVIKCLHFSKNPHPSVVKTLGIKA